MLIASFSSYVRSQSAVSAMSYLEAQATSGSHNGLLHELFVVRTTI